MALVSPDGVKIIGLQAVIHGVALATFGRSPGGTLFDYEYAGETSVDWDSQQTVLNEHGTPLFADEDGGLWSASDLHWSEDDATTGQSGEDGAGQGSDPAILNELLGH